MSDHVSADKVVTVERLRKLLGPRQRREVTVALANGVFDLLHVGHLRYLEAAAGEGDRLVVAVNSDDSVRALRGEGRPVVPAGERAELIAGLACVDHVVVFDAADVGPLLETLRPDVHCKGTDYTAATVPERAVSERLGIRVAIVGDPKAHATRDLIARIRGRDRDG